MWIGDLHCEYFIPESRLKKSIISLCVSPLFQLLYFSTNATTLILKSKRNRREVVKGLKALS